MYYNTKGEYEKRIDEVTDLLEGAYAGNYMAQAKLKESISTSDFPEIFTVITNAQVRAGYDTAVEKSQGVWTKIAQRILVPNFKPQAFIEYGWDDAYGAGNILAQNGGYTTIPGKLPNVPEGTEYPTGAFKLYRNQEQLLEIRKSGARVPFTFEAIINDEWDAVQKLPDFLVTTALDSEDIEVTQLLTDGDGPNSAYFTADNGNLLKYGTNTDGTAALTRDTLKAALIQANSFKVGLHNNIPVRFARFAVVIPPSLSQIAEDIQAAPTQFLVQDGNITYTDTYTMPTNYEFVENTWLEAVDATHGNTAWYVVPLNGTAQRTTLGLGFLRGHDRPEVRIHNDQGLLLGGGAVNPQEGSFLDDTWQLRIRHIFGGVAANKGIGTVASTGASAPTTV